MDCKQENAGRFLRIDPILASAWCQAFARSVASQDIRRDPTVPYLTRYYLAGWNPVTQRNGPSVFLHHFHNSDPADEVHSHPWGWSASLILSGGYREYRCELGQAAQVLEYRPGDVNVLRPDTRHRIELLGPDCWTLFLAGTYAQPWQFFPNC